ncbi:MAG: glucose-1-phosphate adenylyltransferase subunit GlgD [Tissierellia bacterium]|nr:glucose-1-phosphate adenylyltransferase subunit GlgD [Tissierellia bacterium]
MEKCIGVINSGVTTEIFDTLCKTRPTYMLPFAGRYRLIDFALSNMSNHNVSNVVVYGGKNLRSTLDHLGNGQSWELNRRRNGLFVFPPIYHSDMIVPTDIANYYNTLTFYEHSTQKNMFIDNPMTVVKMDLQDAFEKFIEEDLDVMLFYKTQKDPDGYYLNTSKIILNEQGKLLNIGMNLGTENEFNLYLGKMLIKKDLFITLVKEAVEKGNAHNLRQAIINNKHILKIGTYHLDGHVEVIRDTRTYYQANMNLLNPDIYHELFFGRNMIYTKSKDEPPTTYKSTSKVNNSLIANGCIIEGHVENSIVFRGVKIGKDSIVRNSIIIQKSSIGSDAIVVNVITDKYASIGDGVTVVGNPLQPYVVGKSQVIVKGNQ